MADYPMIYEVMTEGDFVNRFADYGREDNFTVQARRWLFDYYMDFASSTGESIEFDAVSICCEWGEYEKPEDMIYDYGYLADLDNDAPATDENIEKVTDVFDDRGVTWTKLESYDGKVSWLVQSF